MNFSFINRSIVYYTYDEYDDDSNETERFLNYYNNIYDLAFSISDKADNCLSVIGTLGNFCALFTLMKSRTMSTPSFVYHKVLIAADLLICFNTILVKILNRTSVTEIGYKDALSSFYVNVAYRALSSTLGYVVLYMSVAVSIDRFIALLLARFYDKFNRKWIAFLNVTVCLLLSAFVHSWSTLFEKRRLDMSEPINVTSASATGQAAINFMYVERQNANLRSLIRIKDIYNMTVRIIFPILLTFLTASVIYAYNVQHRRRRTLCTTINKRRLRRERCLFLLMIAVVILVYVQVVPRETKRIFDMFYPITFLKKQIKNRALPLNVRQNYFRIRFWHEMLKLIQNTCTAIDRSLLFYLYFVLNYNFRREVIRVFRLNQYCCFKATSSSGSRAGKFRNGASTKDEQSSICVLQKPLMGFTSSANYKKKPTTTYENTVVGFSSTAL